MPLRYIASQEDTGPVTVLGADGRATQGPGNALASGLRSDTTVRVPKDRFDDAPEPVFPAAELLTALSGIRSPQHPISAWAVDLLHRCRMRREGDLDFCTWSQHRSIVVHGINTWAHAHAPQHLHGARLHTETVGDVIDRIARVYDAFQVRQLRYRADDPHVHQAWSHVAELYVAYQDLAVEVLQGRRRLPAMAARVDSRNNI